jgi:hypothetical protein
MDLMHPLAGKLRSHRSETKLQLFPQQQSLSRLFTYLQQNAGLPSASPHISSRSHLAQSLQYSN